MPNYVYKVGLTSDDFRQFKDLISMGQSDPKIESEHKKSQAKGILTNLGLATLQMAATSAGSRAVVEVMPQYQRSVEGVKAATLMNAPNTFYCNDNQELKIAEPAIDIDEVRKFDQGKEVAEPLWTNDLPTSEKLEELRKGQLTLDDPRYLIEAYVVSPIPPEVMHKQGSLPMGMLTTNEDDAIKLAKMDFAWSETLVNRHLPKTQAELVSTIPFEIMYTIDPSAIDPNKEIFDAKVYQSYERLQKSWQQVLKKAEKASGEHYLSFLNPLFEIIPLWTKHFETPQLKELKASYQTYENQAKEYRQLLAVQISKKPNTQLDDTHKLITNSVSGMSMHRRLREMDDVCIMMLKPDLFLMDLTSKHGKAEVEEKIYLMGAYSKGSKQYREALINLVNKTKLTGEEYLQFCNKVNSHVDLSLQRANLFNRLNEKELNLLDPDFIKKLFPEINNSELFIKRKNPEGYRELIQNHLIKMMKTINTPEEMGKYLHKVNIDIYQKIIIEKINKADSLTLRSMSPESFFHELNNIDLKSQDINKIYSAKTMNEDNYRRVLKQNVNKIIESYKDQPDELAKVLEQLHANVKRIETNPSMQVIDVYKKILIEKIGFEKPNPNKVDSYTLRSMTPESFFHGLNVGLKSQDIDKIYYANTIDEMKYRKALEENVNEIIKDYQDKPDELVKVLERLHANVKRAEASYSMTVIHENPDPTKVIDDYDKDKRNPQNEKQSVNYPPHRIK